LLADAWGERAASFEVGRGGVEIGARGCAGAGAVLGELGASVELLRPLGLKLRDAKAAARVCESP
jgi:hypothetical protein